MTKPKVVMLRWFEDREYQMSMTLQQACDLLTACEYSGPMPTDLTEAGKLIDQQHVNLVDELAQYQADTYVGCERSIEQATVEA